MATTDDHPGAPAVSLGELGEDSIAASIFALVGRGAELRPELAAEMRGSVLLRFEEGYAPVRIDFRGDQIEVADVDGADADRAHDLEVRGRLPDVITLMAAPLAGGLPRPTHPRGRQALARLADGRVDLDGPLNLGRKLVQLLSVAPEAGNRRDARRRATTRRTATSS